MSIFSKVPAKRPTHSTFHMPHSRKFSMGFGMLYPCFVAEVVPSDFFKINTSQMVRMAPMIAPPMHQFDIYTHFFFVPNRILWANWQDFITGGKDGDQNPTFPYLPIDRVQEADLSDFMGLPNWPIGVTRNVNALPYAAYQKIWYEFFRDQNLEAEITRFEPGEFPLNDGSNPLGTFNVKRNRAWRKDYFTSALPWTQRGPEVTIPLGTEADLAWDDGPLAMRDNPVPPQPPFYTAIKRADGASFGANDIQFIASATGDPVPINVEGGNAQLDITQHTTFDPSLRVDLSTATAATINDLRRAYRLQEWLEKNARGGARYNEQIIVHFNISPGDARLQRPEFLGGSKTPIVISEVLQTSSNADEPTPQGNMSGHGISVGGKNVVRYRAREHGYIIGIVSALPKAAYQQGIPKHFFKFDRFDYAWPTFANLGEQPILNKELFVDDDGLDDEVFGYTPRYAEYKYIPDTVHGAFRTSLDFWHGGRKFTSRPSLNWNFVRMNPSEISRIFAVSALSEEQLYVQMHHDVLAKRPLPYFGTPIT